MAPASVSKGTSFPPLYIAVVAAAKYNGVQPLASKTKKIIIIEIQTNEMNKIESILSQPPMCFPPMNTLGTVLCPEICCNADWISLPSPSIKRKICTMVMQLKLEKGQCKRS